MTHRTCTVFCLGHVPYLRAWDLQRSLAQRRGEGAIGDTLLLLEHPHVYTVGRRGRLDDVLLPAAELAALGVHVVDVDRGGEVTYHGPGQLVAYPILDVRPLGGPVAYVRSLERAMVDALEALGVEACSIPGLTGVWVAGGPGRVDRKIGAIGVRISRGITSHGFALNVNTDLAYFRHIVACGIDGLETTSVERELDRHVDMALARREVAAALGRRLGAAMRWAGTEEAERLVGSPDRMAGSEPD
jgi:lipoyl(octanoyl) transferase